MSEGARKPPAGGGGVGTVWARKKNSLGSLTLWAASGVGDPQAGAERRRDAAGEVMFGSVAWAVRH